VRELEEAIAAHPAVARVADFGLPHKEKGETPAAAVELHSGAWVGELKGLMLQGSCPVEHLTAGASEVSHQAFLKSPRHQLELQGLQTVDLLAFTLFVAPSIPAGWMDSARVGDRTDEVA
jgi:acyl-CoA synthetase (AMP-forming)/AMP-acid ligase II